MNLKLAFLPLLLVATLSWAQPARKAPADSTPVVTDSLLITDLKENLLDNIPQVSIDENDATGAGGGQSVSSVLGSSRDPFFSAATYNFSAARYRFRGYDNDFNSTYMNGISMENLDNGFTPFGLWGGLNDVTRNREIVIGLRSNTFSIGDLGTSVNFDTRASRQRKQTEFSYSYANRNYDNKFSFTHSTGMTKKGWAVSLSGSFRGATEGYIPGTYYNGYSYFAAIDKKISQKHLLSFVGFGAPTENGRQGAAVEEMQTLSNDKFYNPNWGYQNGKKRNASIGRTNQPVMILTHDYKIDKNSSLLSAIGYSFGDRSTTALDWYNAADPRPDYYRYLPSYQDDTTLRNQLTEAFKSNVNLRQIDWARLYDVNRNSIRTIYNANGIAGNNVTGLRSRYIVERRVTNTKRANVRTVFNTKINKNIDFTYGMSYQYQKNNYYKRVEDLLGGEFYVDLNQYAERDFPSDTGALQNDINRPNRILKTGDKFGYDYDIVINRSAAFTQGVFRFKFIDLFVSTELSNTQFWRVGNVKSGLYLNNSFGKSADHSFNNYNIKGGVTFKVNSRNYLYVNAAQLTRAPFFENAYISPRTRDEVQNNLKSERIKTIEGGYVVTAPFIKLRISGYATEFKNGLNVMTFYHDDYRNFVNYAISNINKVHFGGELGFESRVVKNVTITGAASVGRYYYNSRQNVSITQDNSATPLGTSTVYSQNFRIAATPQEAYSLGIQYRSPHYWFLGLTGNYFDQMWLEFNPLRHSYEALQDIPYQSAKWNEIIAQRRLPGQTTLDFFGGFSWKLPQSLSFKRKTFFALSANVSNLLNNKNLISGGFEQLRYDFVENDVNKFPSKLFYAYGLNYSINASIRF